MKQRNIFRVVRNCLGLTLNEMARECKISRVYLSELERGVKTNPSHKFLEKFSAVCGLEVETLEFFIEKEKSGNILYTNILRRALVDYQLIFLRNY